MSVAAAASVTPIKKPIHPLRVRDFRLLWIGESISLLGDQFYLIALPWLVLQITDSALALGIVLAFASVPRALFMLVGGVLVDRFSPRTVMFLSNFARMILVGLLALLVLTNNIQLWMLYVLALGFGTADAFYIPAQTTMVPVLLKSDQLEMGNTLTQGMAMLSMFLGPVLAGVVVAALSGSATEANPGTEGIGIAFAFDALSFLASLAALWMISDHRTPSASDHKNVLSSIKEGMSYVWNSTVLRMLFILLIGINFFIAGSFEVGMPVLVKLNLTEGAAAYGIVMSAYGAGALLGVILSSVLPKPKPTMFGLSLLGITALLGVGMILLPFSSSTLIVALISLAMGTTMGYVNLNFMTWLQRRIPEQLMGRVMSLLMFASMGVAPVSSALAGAVLNFSFVGLFVGAGVLLTALTLLFATRPATRQMGTEVAETKMQQTIGEILRSTDEIPATLRTTSTMPAIRL